MTNEQLTSPGQPEQQVLAIFEAISGNSMLIQTDAPKFTILAATPGYCNTSGRTRDFLIGKGVFEAFPGSDNPKDSGTHALHDSLMAVIESKKPQFLPLHRYDIQNTDGRYKEKYWKTSNVPVFSPDGEVTYIVHTSEDITGQVIAEQHALPDSGIEKAYRFFMNAPVMMGYVKGENYTIELANEGLLEIWGRSADVVGEPLFSAIPELEGQGLKDLLDKVKTTGAPFFAYEYPIRLVRNGKEDVLYFDFVYKAFYEEGYGNLPSGVVSVGHEVSDRVNAKQKFKTILEQAADPILILKGEDMVLDTANDALFKMWKVDHSAIGKTFLEILPEMKGQGFLELLQQVYHTGETFQGFETPAVFDEEDGTNRTVYFNFTYQPYREADGTISGVLVLASDVTGQVLAKKEIKESQDKLRLSIEQFDLIAKATQDAVWIWNLESGAVLWNESVGINFGFKADEIEPTATWWYEHIHPDDREHVTHEIHLVIDGKSKSGDFWMGEYRFLCADGLYKTVLDRGYVQRNTDGAAIRMIGSMQDITERINHELSLKESQQKWQQLADAVPAFVWSATADGHIDYLNNLWYEFTGMSQDQSFGSGWTRALHPDDVDRCVSAWHNAWEKETHYEVEVRYRSKEGYYRWVLVRGVPIFKANGQLQAWFGTSTDIHDQKMLSENLEKIVAERTEELKRSNASLEQFAYAASHDMKEPIRKIHFFSDRLKGRLADKMDVEDFRMFEKLEKASKRMSTLIDDLLAYSQISEGAVDLGQVDLNKKVQLVLEDLELELQDKKASVNVGVLPVVTGNRRQFQQLFQNLISNAFKYSKHDQPPVVDIHAQVVIGSQVKPDLPGKGNGRKYHLLEVRDNGIGFNQEDAERIFDVFTRLHGNSEYSGTGVGLSIVRKVVDSHGGYIWAESTPGKGSTFKILLPTEP
ncbi:hypothetical protein SAMN05444008_105128 [Cnuella takakiae]|uniref:histidine kinase n=1 Tax=Cnuella takakiae TaxID=1302690 RepID=A0A1M4Z939_9BACT|nr:PAS domain S-box protein [Cnuella takakiae]OLY94294.1 hypothetical protein BUE76_22195 [Cnuella takakiae]SHF14302.1 hypothetical protein SAMN05444008_105128 [Cnuella takakiae]